MFLPFYLFNMFSSLVGPGWEEAAVRSQLASIDADLGRFRVTPCPEARISVGVRRCSKLRRKCTRRGSGSVVPDRSCAAVLHLPEVTTSSSSSSFSTFFNSELQTDDKTDGKKTIIFHT